MKKVENYREYRATQHAIERAKERGCTSRIESKKFLKKVKEEGKFITCRELNNNWVFERALYRKSYYFNGFLYTFRGNVLLSVRKVGHEQRRKWGVS